MWEADRAQNQRWSLGRHARRNLPKSVTNGCNTIPIKGYIDGVAGRKPERYSSGFICYQYAAMRNVLAIQTNQWQLEVNSACCILQESRSVGICWIFLIWQLGEATTVRFRFNVGNWRPSVEPVWPEIQSSFGKVKVEVNVAHTGQSPTFHLVTQLREPMLAN